MAVPTNPTPILTTTGSSQLTPRLRDAFWKSVEACLVQFHSKSTSDAAVETGELRHKIDNPPPDIDGELIYHQEPFYVACDLAHLNDIGEQERLLASHANRYAAILSRYGW
jgi:hypothetical protein